MIINRGSLLEKPCTEIENSAKPSCTEVETSTKLSCTAWLVAPKRMEEACQKEQQALIWCICPSYVDWFCE